MLVLSRKPQQQILIPELNIVVTVLSIAGHRVQLGISAPDDVRISRGELAPEAPRRSLSEETRLRAVATAFRSPA
ncbi:MAG: carbon storage regulator [Planctomycetaceae bacterium]|nr:carbon storage regulator [Planctomycetaceae bacterium]